MIVFFSLLLIKKIRILTMSYITSTLALLLALISYIRGNELNIWEKIDDMRDYDFEDQQINELLF